MRSPDYSPLDDALDEIAPYGIELNNGNSNHAPMVAEALCALARPEAVAPWLARYRDRMLPRPPVGRRIGRDDWRGALGRRERFADWAAFFAAELGEAAWPAVLDRWVERLAPGFGAAATHGVIRVGHAARGLAGRDTPSRRRELADALAGWAVTWQQLAPSGRAAIAPMPPDRAIALVPLVPPERRRGGNIVTGLAALADVAEFAPVIDLLDTGGPLPPPVAGVAETFARVALANTRNIPTAIAFIHAVTSIAALGNLAPHLREATARTTLRYAWQCGCGLYACYGDGPALREPAASSAIEGADLIERAIACGDEHAIKFTEACLGRDAIAPSAAYHAAADRILGILCRR